MTFQKSIEKTIYYGLKSLERLPADLNGLGSSVLANRSIHPRALIFPYCRLAATHVLLNCIHKHRLIYTVYTVPLYGLCREYGVHSTSTATTGHYTTLRYSLVVVRHTQYRRRESGNALIKCAKCALRRSSIQHTLHSTVL